MNETTLLTLTLCMLALVPTAPRPARAEGVADIMLGCETPGNEDIMPGDDIDVLGDEVARAVRLADLIQAVPERELARKAHELASAILAVESAARKTPAARGLGESLHGRSREVLYGLQSGGARAARLRAGELRQQMLRGLALACAG